MALADTHTIVALKTGLPSGYTTKREVNAEIANQKSSDEKRSSFKVDVFAEYLSPVRKHQVASSNWLKLQGLPWAFVGQVLIPNPEMDRVIITLDDDKTENEKLYKQFLMELPANKERDRQNGRLGDLFNEEDFKSEEYLEGRWKFEVLQTPVPDPETDVRAGWSLKQVEDMQRVMRDQQETYIKEATIQMLERIKKPLENIVDKCTRYDGGREGRFSNKTFIGNVRDVVEGMIVNNLKDDPELEDIRRQMVHDICQLEPKDLRESKTLREDTKKKAENILSRIGNFGADL